MRLDHTFIRNEDCDYEIEELDIFTSTFFEINDNEMEDHPVEIIKEKNFEIDFALDLFDTKSV